MTPSEPAPSNVVAFPNGEVLRLQLVASTLLEALKGVLRVADRQTVEFDAARDAIALAEKGAAR